MSAQDEALKKALLSFARVELYARQEADGGMPTLSPNERDILALGREVQRLERLVKELHAKQRPRK